MFAYIYFMVTIKKKSRMTVVTMEIKMNKNRPSFRFTFIVRCDCIQTVCVRLFVCFGFAASHIHLMYPTKENGELCRVNHNIPLPVPFIFFPYLYYHYCDCDAVGVCINDI